MVNRAGNVAHRSAVLNDLVQFRAAVQAYHTDYGVYPIDPSIHWTGAAAYGIPGGPHHNSDVMNVLRADGTDPGPNFQNAINSRAVVYMDVPQVRDLSAPRSGLGNGKETNGFGVTTPGEWYDPWGSPYLFFIDTGGSGIRDLGLIYTDLTFSGPNPDYPPTAVVGVSLGKDGKIGTNGNGKYAGSDDVIYWPGSINSPH